MNGGGRRKEYDPVITDPFITAYFPAGRLPCTGFSLMAVIDYCGGTSLGVCRHYYHCIVVGVAGRAVSVGFQGGRGVGDRIVPLPCHARLPGRPGSGRRDGESFWRQG